MRCCEMLQKRWKQPGYGRRQKQLGLTVLMAPFLFALLTIRYPLFGRRIVNLVPFSVSLSTVIVP